MDQQELLRQVLGQTRSLESARRKNGEPPPAEKQPPEGAKLLPLPEPELLPDTQVNFLELIELRTTQRKYSGESLNLKELSYLLWCTQGVKMAMPNGGSRRNVPSAGARHAFETYLFVQRVDGLPAGFYRFLAFEHALLPLRELSATTDAREAFLSSFHSRPVVENSAVTFVWAAEPERMLYPYGARGIRYLYLDAGHVCENLYLAAESMRLGACALGAFEDEQLGTALGMDQANGEFAIYGAAVGKL